MISLRGRCLVLALVVGACTREKETTPDSTVAASGAAPGTTYTTPPATQTANSCPHTGLWSACTIERRLKQAGFVVKKLEDKPERAGFTLKPAVYSLGSSRLEVFIYDDENALARDLQSLDTLAAAPKGSTATWPSAPTFIRSANLAAVFLTQNPRQAERLVLAITAGPPQPGSPR